MSIMPTKVVVTIMGTGGLGIRMGMEGIGENRARYSVGGRPRDQAECLARGLQ